MPRMARLAKGSSLAAKHPFRWVRWTRNWARCQGLGPAGLGAPTSAGGLGGGTGRAAPASASGYRSNVVSSAPSSATNTASSRAGSVALAFSLTEWAAPGGSSQLSPAYPEATDLRSRVDECC